MILQIFAMRDRRADAYGNPMFMPSRGSAIRSFGDVVNSKDKDNLVSAHPEDFDLFYLGTFDTATADFVTQRAEQIAVGLDLVVR